MSERSLTHTSFTIERVINAPVEKVFNAFATQEAKQKWFSGPEDWNQGERSFDFREGGIETDEGGPVGQPVSKFKAVYQDIVPNSRIIYTYEMFQDNVRTSVSLAMFQFKPEGDKTLLTLIEDGAFLDGLDTAEGRKEGTEWLIGNLAKSVES